MANNNANMGWGDREEVPIEEEAAAAVAGSGGGRGDDEGLGHGLGPMYNREAGTWRERLTRSGITDSERTKPTARGGREWEAW